MVKETIIRLLGGYTPQEVDIALNEVVHQLTANQPPVVYGFRTHEVEARKREGLDLGNL